MRIVCSSCSAAYDVPDSLVTAGRVVRCVRCAHEWTPIVSQTAADASLMPHAAPGDVVRPDVPEPVASVVEAVARQTAMQRLAASAAQPRSPVPLRLAWVVSFVVLAVAAWGAYAWRNQIVADWPPSARAYAVFGLHLGTNARQ